MAGRVVETAPNGDRGYWSTASWTDPEGRLKTKTVWTVVRPKPPKLVKDGEDGLIQWLREHVGEVRTPASESAGKYDE